VQPVPGDHRDESFGKQMKPKFFNPLRLSLFDGAVGWLL